MATVRQAKARARTKGGMRIRQTEGERTCTRRGCDTPIGYNRRWCADHLPRRIHPGSAEAKLLDGTFLVFGVPKRGAPYEVLGHFKSQTDAYGFRNELVNEAEYGYVTSEGRTILVASDDTALNGSPEMRQAIEDYLDLLEEGGQTMATVRQAAAKGKSRARRSATGNGSRPEPRECLCECGDMTAGGRFLPGHDAKLKGRLQSEYREGTAAAQRKLEKQFEKLGWEKFIPDLEAEERKHQLKLARLRKLRESKASGSKAKRKSAKRKRARK